MRLILRSLAVLFFLLAGQQAYAGKGDRVPSYEGCFGGTGRNPELSRTPALAD